MACKHSDPRYQDMVLHLFYEHGIGTKVGIFDDALRLRGPSLGPNVGCLS
jgi:hypothetical protein